MEANTCNLLADGGAYTWRKSPEELSFEYIEQPERASADPASEFGGTSLAGRIWYAEHAGNIPLAVVVAAVESP